MTNPTKGENVFFADLHHPGGETEEITRLLNEIPTNAQRIFFLGDLFHFWINEQSFIQSKYEPFLNHLEQWAKQGLQLFFLEGNRDFLASHFFENQPWIDVLPNPTVIDIGGRAVYIGHGDELCWNDWAYQLYKSIIRSAPMRYLADRLPAQIRLRTALRLSQASNKIVSNKTKSTLAVPQRAYESIINSGIDVIVHGHLHQTYQRIISVNGRQGQVLAFGWKDGQRNIIHFSD